MLLHCIVNVNPIHAMEDAVGMVTQTRWRDMVEFDAVKLVHGADIAHK